MKPLKFKVLLPTNGFEPGSIVELTQEEADRYNAGEERPRVEVVPEAAAAAAAGESSEQKKDDEGIDEGADDEDEETDKHVVTQEDLDNNPFFATLGIAVGTEVEYDPATVVSREVAIEKLGLEVVEAAEKLNASKSDDGAGAGAGADAGDGNE